MYTEKDRDTRIQSAKTAANQRRSFKFVNKSGHQITRALTGEKPG